MRARIDALVLERLQEAVDAACLEAMVESRRRAGRPAPVMENVADRREHDELVVAFLRRLHVGIADAQTRAVGRTWPGFRNDRPTLVEQQVGLAKRLPDYWQRFDQARQQFAAEQRQRRARGRRLIGRLFG